MDNFNRHGNWFIDQLNVFQSANSDDISIKKNFIVRKEEFELIIDGLKNKSSKDPLQHELILGRRGSGKSTLLKRIEIEIKENTELNNSYIAINLAEEQAGIYRLFDLWEEVINELRQILHIDIQLLEFETFKTNHEYTRYLYQNIHNICQEHKKRIVLLLDNFDRIVENFTDDGSLLRETLINYNDIQLIAGSTRMDEHFWRYDMPFYEFFRTHRLESLSRTEIETLLTHWSESISIPELSTFVNANPGKIENIRILTDGLPRTIQFFVQIVLQKKESDTYEYLKKIMDNVTPLYQERLNHLPAQMRKTILEMAFIWEACTTKQLVERIKMESKLISANLTTLVEKGIVDKIETGKKQHLYRISERFFNMWLIITQGNPEQKRKAKWLSIFLESWYDENDFKRLSSQYEENVRKGSLRAHDALIYSKALSQSKHISLSERDHIISMTKESFATTSEDKLIVLPRLSEEIMSEILHCIKEQNINKAKKLIDEIENEADGVKSRLFGICYQMSKDFPNAEKHYLLGVEKGDLEALFNLAVLYINQGKYTDAEKYYLLAIEKGLVSALNNLAILYINQGKNTEAEKYLLLAIEKGDVDALINLAWFYYSQKKYTDAEKYLLLAIEKGDVDALINLAMLYDNQKKYIDAEKYYLLAIEKGNIGALFNLALLYEDQEKYNDAEKYYLMAIEKEHVYALNNLALLHKNQEKYTDAEKYYLMAIEKDEVIALFNLALLYEDQEKYNDAEKYYLMAIEKGEVKAVFNLALLYTKQQKYTDAEKYYLLAIEKGEDKALFNLAFMYYQTNKNKIIAAELINKASKSDANPTRIIIEIWNGIFKDVEKRVFSIIRKMNFENIEEFIQELLIQQQKNLVLSLFHHAEIGKNLQEKYMVLYYVTLIINNQLENNLMLRIPPELQTTIDDVITKIKERQKIYGYY
jgi:TPR repeat protein/DNA-binding HxlR family transcriptional regulator